MRHGSYTLYQLKIDRTYSISVRCNPIDFPQIRPTVYSKLKCRVKIEKCLETSFSKKTRFSANLKSKFLIVLSNLLINQLIHLFTTNLDTPIAKFKNIISSALGQSI